MIQRRVRAGARGVCPPGVAPTRSWQAWATQNPSGPSNGFPQGSPVHTSGSKADAEKGPASFKRLLAFILQTKDKAIRVRETQSGQHLRSIDILAGEDVRLSGPVIDNDEVYPAGVEVREGVTKLSLLLLKLGHDPGALQPDGRIGWRELLFDVAEDT